MPRDMASQVQNQNLRRLNLSGILSASDKYCQDFSRGLPLNRTFATKTGQLNHTNLAPNLHFLYCQLESSETSHKLSFFVCRLERQSDLRPRNQIDNALPPAIQEEARVQYTRGDSASFAYPPCRQQLWLFWFRGHRWLRLFTSFVPSFGQIRNILQSLPESYPLFREETVMWLADRSM